MATLTAQNIARIGIEPAYAAADALGDEFLNNGNMFIHVKNGHSAAQTVTIASQYVSPPVGTAKSNLSVSVTEGEERMICPFPVSGYNDANGKVQVTYDGVTALTVGVFNMGSSIER